MVLVTKQDINLVEETGRLRGNGKEQIQINEIHSIQN